MAGEALSERMIMQYYDKLKELLAAEYFCDTSDFDIEENVLTEAETPRGGRRYYAQKKFFHMVTTGTNAVITADPALDSFLVRFMKGGKGYELFQIPKLVQLEKELNSHGQTLTDIYRMYLPDRDIEPVLDIPVKWFRDKEINRFYCNKSFPNAICPRPDKNRPDRLVVCAYDGKTIIGMAGASEDADGWMQIGIDVLPGYRSKGIGAYLVTLLKKRVIEEGAIPFYGTSTGNIHSANVALNSGFAPAWTEIGSKRVNKIMAY